MLSLYCLLWEGLPAAYTDMLLARADVAQTAVSSQVLTSQRAWAKCRHCSHTLPVLPLHLLQLVSQEQIEAARTGLSSKAAGDAEAAFEAEKAQVGEARRAELEAQLAAAAEAAAAAAAEAEVSYNSVEYVVCHTVAATTLAP